MNAAERHNFKRRKEGVLLVKRAGAGIGCSIPVDAAVLIRELAAYVQDQISSDVFSTNLSPRTLARVERIRDQLGEANTTIFTHEDTIEHVLRWWEQTNDRSQA